MEEAELQSLTVEAQGQARAGKQPLQMGLLHSEVPAAVWGFPERVAPVQLALRELRELQLVEPQQPDHFHPSLEWSNDCQLVMDAHVP